MRNFITPRLNPPSQGGRKKIGVRKGKRMGIIDKKRKLLTLTLSHRERGKKKIEKDAPIKDAATFEEKE
ncbi:hypothetical protein ACFL6Y_04870 [Elusimicrobiota bacterium]